MTIYVQQYTQTSPLPYLNKLCHLISPEYQSAGDPKGQIPRVVCAQFNGCVLECVGE
jgi:hypothetical protein